MTACSSTERFPSGWLVDDMLWSYGAAVSAIAVNDNVFTLDCAPGRPRRRSCAGTISGLASDFYTIENSVVTSARAAARKNWPWRAIPARA